MLKITTIFVFAFLIFLKIELGSSIFNETKPETQSMEDVPSFPKKAKSEIQILFSKSDFNFHVNFNNLGWRGTVMKFQQPHPRDKH